MLIPIVLVPGFVLLPLGAAYADTDCSPNGIEYSGSSWLDGSGVNVCNYPGDNSHVCLPISGAPGDTNCPAGYVWSGDKWNCVELVNRLYLTKGWTTATWYGNGNTLINNLPSNLTDQLNGSISYVNPGDVITLNSSNPAGHAAIVNSVGGNTLNLINQNGSLNSTANLVSGSLSGGNASYNSSWPGFTVQAIIHHPDGSDTVPDFNGDNRADLAWDQSGTLNLLTGQTSGQFESGGSTNGIYAATWQGAGPFMGNGRSQVVSYDSSTGTITEFQWNGSSWVYANQTTGLGNPNSVVVGDFNGDGRADLAWDQGGTLYLLAGQANGTFTLAGSTAGIYASTWQGAGSFMGGGRAQLASYSAGTGTITEFQWNGSSWGYVSQTTGIGSPDFAVTGYFSGDGRADLAWDQGGTLYLLTGQTNGQFESGGSTGGIYPATWEGAGDFLGDGKYQVASYDASTGAITEFQWNGSSWAWVNQTLGIGSPDFAVVGD